MEINPQEHPVLVVIVLLSAVSFLTLWVSIVYARFAADKEFFDEYLGGRSAIYGGFRLWKSECYKQDKQWVCQIIRKSSFFTLASWSAMILYMIFLA